MKQTIQRVRSGPSWRLFTGIILIAGSLWLAWAAVAVLVDSFTIYRGYEVGLGRVLALVYFVLVAAIAYLGVKLTRSSGKTLVGVVGGLMLAGIAAAAAAMMQAIPEPPAEVMLVLKEYTVDQSTGECSGAGELSQVVEGSKILVMQVPETAGRPVEIDSVALPAGSEGREGCVFELGNPLGRPVGGYENIDFEPASQRFHFQKSVAFEGHRVIVKLLAPEPEG